MKTWDEIVDKILEFREIEKSFKPYLKYEQAMCELITALEESDRAVVVTDDRTYKEIIKIESSINFGHYSNQKNYDSLAKLYDPRLGVCIDHFGDAFGDDYDNSYLTYALNGESIKTSIKKLKKIMPKVKVRWTEEKEL